MANRYQKESRERRHAARLDFLQTWRLLPILPSDRQDVDEHASAALVETAAVMVQLGLYARSSARTDVKNSIRRAVGEVRRRAS